MPEQVWGQPSERYDPAEVTTWRKYRKKPVVVEARRADPGGEVIPTLEGEMRAEPGDYIVRGIQGEVYPVKPAIFRATYELVEKDRAPA